MSKKNHIIHDQLQQLKPQLYSISSDDYSFQEILDLFKQQLGEYPGTLLQKPIAVDYFNIKENILLAYSIARPKNKNKEQIIEDAFEEADIDLNDLDPTISLGDLPLEMILKIQFITHFLCQNKIILLDSWINKLPDEKIKEITLFFKQICQQQKCAILIYSSNHTIIQRCDETLYLDSLLSVS